MNKARPGQTARGVLFLLAAAGLVLWAWSLGPETSAGARLGLTWSAVFAARPALLLCALAAAAGGLVGLSGSKRQAWLGAGLGFTAVIAAALIGAGLARPVELAGLGAQSLRLAAPICLGALAGLVSERSGVVNIGIEGMMLAGACLGALAGESLHSPWLGLGVAVLAGAAMGGLHALLCVACRAEQIVSGMVLNILALGGTGFLHRAFIAGNPLQAAGLLPVGRLPWLSEIPALGQIIFSHQPLVYAALVLPLVLHLALFRSVWGLRTRMCGENPAAAEARGVNVARLRVFNLLLSGMLAGLAGAWFSLETVGGFETGMTGGKGFIALAAMIFGRWRPFGAFFGALLFGFADALQMKLQIAGSDVPYQIVGMLPYAATLVALAGFVGKAEPPAALGKA